MEEVTFLNFHGSQYSEEVNKLYSTFGVAKLVKVHVSIPDVNLLLVFARQEMPASVLSVDFFAFESVVLSCFIVIASVEFDCKEIACVVGVHLG